jgi:2-oxoglutarate dehydrogenase E1 component
MPPSAPKRDDVAIVRLEQLYPFPQEARRYRAAKWVQEEPVNMGAWAFIRLEAWRRRHVVARLSRAVRLRDPASGTNASRKSSSRGR